jgi:DNA-binding NarL/FixJ family response regulator
MKIVTALTGRRIEVHEASPASALRFVPRTVVVTPAQKLVLDCLLEDGADNRTIGRRLGSSEETVKTHVRDLLRRFDVPNRTALVCEILHRRVTVAVETQQQRNHK